MGWQSFPEGETHVWLEVHTHYVEFLNHDRCDSGSTFLDEALNEGDGVYRPWSLRYN